MNTLTHTVTPTEAAQHLRSEIMAARRNVMHITGLSEDEINTMIFDSAYDYLAFMGCDEHMAHQFAITAEFWGFWKKTWYEMDQHFIYHYHRWQYDRYYAASWYACFHNYKGNPMNSPRLSAAYHSLIKTLAVKR
jgi:hypothetical protein